MTPSWPDGTSNTTKSAAESALLAGVKPNDLATFGGAVAVAGFMLVVGTVLPTLRALGVDPIKAIRAE